MNKLTTSMKLEVIQGNAADLLGIADKSYDICLCLGPLYHLFDEKDIDKAINEMKRVTKQDGCIFMAFLSQDYIMMRAPEKVFIRPVRLLIMLPFRLKVEIEWNFV